MRRDDDGRGARSGGARSKEVEQVFGGRLPRVSRAKRGLTAWLQPSIPLGCTENAKARNDNDMVGCQRKNTTILEDLDGRGTRGAIEVGFTRLVRGLHQTCWLRQHAPRHRREARLVVGVDGRNAIAREVNEVVCCTIHVSRACVGDVYHGLRPRSAGFTRETMKQASYRISTRSRQGGLDASQISTGGPHVLSRY